MGIIEPNSDINPVRRKGAKCGNGRLFLDFDCFGSEGGRGEKGSREVGAAASSRNVVNSLNYNHVLPELSGVGAAIRS
jgi:hypothetical protein